MRANCHEMSASYGNGTRFRAGNVVAMNHDNATEHKPRRLSESEAATYLGVLSVRTLQDWRRKRVGPAYSRLGRRVAYSTEDLDAYLAASRVEPKGVTSQAGGA